MTPPRVKVTVRTCQIFKGRHRVNGARACMMQFNDNTTGQKNLLTIVFLKRVRYQPHCEFAFFQSLSRLFLLSNEGESSGIDLFSFYVLFSQYKSCDNTLYKITKIVRALLLVERSVCMRVRQHCCGVKMFYFSRANHASTNLKKFSSSKHDKFTSFTHSFVS